MPAANGGFRHLARDMGTAIRATATASNSIATPPAFVTASGFSIACWVRVFDFSTTQNIIGEAATTGAPVFRVATANRLELIPRTSAGTVLSNAVLRRGEWHHVACTWDAVATRATLYCDGEVVQQAIGLIGGVAFAQPAAACTMGLLAGGRADRLGFWGRELTQAEIRLECYESAGPTPVARYRFDDAIGTTAVDDMGGASMSLGNCVFADDAPIQPIRTGQDWGSIFQGTAGYITLASASGDNMGVAMAGVGSYQVSMWVRQIAATASIDLFRVTSNGVVALRLQLDGGTNFIVTARSTADASGAARATNVAVPLSLGQWVHYSAQINIADGAAGTIRLYRNGILLASAAADFAGQTSVAWTTVTTNCPSWLGAGNAAANPFPGWIGPARIDAAMTAAQLRRLIFTGVEPAPAYLQWQHTAGSGANTLNTGSRAGMAGTLAGGAVWSLEAPW
jgi:hypothetical protein